MNKTTNKYSPEMRERAVRMDLDGAGQLNVCIQWEWKTANDRKSERDWFGCRAPFASRWLHEITEGAGWAGRCARSAFSMWLMKYAVTAFVWPSMRF